MDVTDIKAFVPSKDYRISKAFYSEIGFESEYVSEDLTLFQNGDCLFFLQRFFNQELAQNFMLQICFSDVEEAFNLCSKSKISSVTIESWGKVFYLWGPQVSFCTFRSWAANKVLLSHFSVTEAQTHECFAIAPYTCAPR